MRKRFAGLLLAVLTVLGMAAPASAYSKPPVPSHLGAATATSRASLSGTGPFFYYTVGSESPVGGASGISSLVDVVKPVINTGKGDAHSLWEMSVQDTVHHHILEFGWTVDPGLNGDANPHLFAFLWVNGGATQYNTPFISAPTGSCTTGGAGPALGSTLALVSLRQFGTQHIGTWPNGAWWMQLDSGSSTKSVACIKDSTLISRGVTTDFSKGDYFQVFGELANTSHDNSVGVKPCGQIGTGAKGSLGSGAARWSNTAWVGNSNTVKMYTRSESNTGVMDTDYDTKVVSPPDPMQPNYGRSAYWGGSSTAGSPTC